MLLASGLDRSSSPKDLLLEKSSLNKTETDFQYTYIEKFIHFRIKLVNFINNFIKASEARLVVEFFAIGTGAQGYRLLTRNAPLSEKTP